MFTRERISKGVRILRTPTLGSYGPQQSPEKFWQMKKSILSLVLGALCAGCGVAGSSKSAAVGTETSAQSSMSYKNSGYTEPELDAMGVNTRHLFVFTDQRATYNGKRFSINHPIDSLIAVFGPDYRILRGKEHNEGYDHYFWDEIGFVALASPEREVLGWNLHWEYLPKEKEYDYDDPDPALVPAKFFKGKILLNGVPLDNTSDYAQYCNNKEVQQQLREWARERGIENYMECFYYYHPMTINRYQHTYHKLYFFDYTPFGSPTFFSYRMKIATQTGKMHEMAMQYDVYTNPDAIKLF